MGPGSPRSRRMLFAVLLAASLSLRAFGQAQSGTLFGSTLSNGGTALPRVTVTLSGVGAPQVVVTDEEGRFRFPNLSPGTYRLQAELSGVGSFSQEGIGVRLGGSPDITITLSPSAEQTITVTADAPLLDVRKTGTGATLSQVELQAVPSGRGPGGVLQPR